MIGDRWGVDEHEVTRHYPCDDLVPEPVLQAWRGVTVRAAPEQVWPWVAQIRLAPYSYDWIDNLGHTSPRELRGLPDPEVGEPFTTVGGGRPCGTILSVHPGVSYTGEILGSVLSYVLAARDAGTTRLLLKVVLRTGRLIAPAISLGDLVMSRRQLLTLARLAETSTSG